MVSHHRIVEPKRQRKKNQVNSRKFVRESVHVGKSKRNNTSSKNWGDKSSGKPVFHPHVFYLSLFSMVMQKFISHVLCANVFGLHLNWTNFRNKNLYAIHADVWIQIITEISTSSGSSRKNKYLIFLSNISFVNIFSRHSICLFQVGFMQEKLRQWMRSQWAGKCSII